MQVPKQAEKDFLKTLGWQYMPFEIYKALTAAFAAVPEPVGGEWTGEWTDAMHDRAVAMYGTFEAEFRAAYAVAPKRPILGIPAEISEEAVMAAASVLWRTFSHVTDDAMRKTVRDLWTALRAQLLRERAATQDVVENADLIAKTGGVYAEATKAEPQGCLWSSQPDIAELAEQTAVALDEAAKYYGASKETAVYRALAALIRAQEAERVRQIGRERDLATTIKGAAFAARAEGGSK